MATLTPEQLLALRNFDRGTPTLGGTAQGFGAAIPAPRLNITAPAGTQIPAATPQAQGGGGIRDFIGSDKGQQVGRGLLGLGAALSGGPTSAPRSFLQALSQGAQGFAGGAQQARAEQAATRQQQIENALRLGGAGAKGTSQVINEPTGKTDDQGRDLFQTKLINKQTGETIRELGTPAPKARAFATPEQEKRISQAKRKGALGAERQDKIQKAAAGAVNKLGTFNELGRQLDEAEAAGFETGALAGIEITGKRAALGLAGLFGFDIDFKGLDSAEAIRALGNQLAQQARAGTGEGTTLAGQMSDKDVEFLKASMPGLDKTIAGNRLLIEIQRKLANRQIEYARLAREYENRTGILDAGFNVFAQERLGDVFDDDFIERTTNVQQESGLTDVSTDDLIKAFGGGQ
jgi:hypothetical protein